MRRRVDADDPSITLREADHADVPAMLALKAALPLREGSRGGFLLGTTEAGYHALVDGGIVWTLRFDDQLVGFASALRDPALRASPLWERRPQIAWMPGFGAIDLDAMKIGYFDQIAVRPSAGPRLFAPALGLRVLADLLDDGHEHVITTTVETPILNRVALAFLERLGGLRIAAVDEVYPEVGPLTSAIHYLNAAVIRDRIASARAEGRPTLLRLLDLAGV
ncbi:MAG: hypothetical protein R3B09_21445 [Nannocystaceae bacterium]